MSIRNNRRDSERIKLDSLPENYKLSFGKLCHDLCFQLVQLEILVDNSIEVTRQLFD